MAEDGLRTVALRISTKERLAALKVIDTESYDSVIRRILDERLKEDPAP